MKVRELPANRMKALPPAVIPDRFPLALGHTMQAPPRPQPEQAKPLTGAKIFSLNAVFIRLPGDDRSPDYGAYSL